MSRRRLKNYQKYLDTLNFYAKASKIKVKYKLDDYFDGGMYVPHNRTVYLEPDLSNSEEIASFLHELGHTLENVAQVSHGEAAIIHKAYSDFYAGNHSFLQKMKILQRERMAWDFAESIAQLLQIPLGLWFYRYKKECLKTYENP